MFDSKPRLSDTLCPIPWRCVEGDLTDIQGGKRRGTRGVAQKYQGCDTEIYKRCNTAFDLASFNELAGSNTFLNNFPVGSHKTSK